MRAYVTGSDHMQYTNLADGMVQINATHSNLKQYVMELRLDLHTKIADVKRKLYTHNGTSISHMHLILKDEEGNDLCAMGDDDRPLGYYGAQNGYTIHVVDQDPFSLSKDGGLDDVSKIQKYRMADEDYDKREKTLRAYKKKMLSQDPNFRFLPENRARAEARAKALETYQKPECAAHVTVESRCKVTIAGSFLGTVRYVGLVPSIDVGYWVGIQLDEPYGKGDGSRGGVTYFEGCPDKYGMFVRPDNVTCGEFTAEDLELETPSDSAAAPADSKDGAGCACGHSHDDAAVHAETTAVMTADGISLPNPSAAPAKAAIAASTGGSRVTVLQRKGGRRADDDDDDDNDDEL